jgi:alkylation response protein AidB-like acyl-CoA dehydrogenase
MLIISDFNKERLLMAIGMNRRARNCLSVALDYAHDRHTFGQPLIAHQIMRHKFSTMARYIESHYAWIEQLAYHVKVRGWTDELASRIALAKIHGGRLLELSNREAQQVLGGAGYQKGGVGGVIEQTSRDLRMLVVGGGSEEILADLAVRQELAVCRKRGCNL